MKYPPEIAYSKLVDWCNKAERCRFDLIRKLKVWGADGPFIETCLGRLSNSNLFDDARFASAFANDKSTIQRWGAQKIRMHLRSRGILDEYIQDALTRLEPETQQLQIRELASRKWPAMKGKNDYERTSKLIAFLMRKGFSYEDIKRELANKHEWPDDINLL